MTKRRVQGVPERRLLFLVRRVGQQGEGHCGDPCEAGARRDNRRPRLATGIDRGLIAFVGAAGKRFYASVIKTDTTLYLVAGCGYVAIAVFEPAWLLSWVTAAGYLVFCAWALPALARPLSAKLG